MRNPKEITINDFLADAGMGGVWWANSNGLKKSDSIHIIQSWKWSCVCDYEYYCSCAEYFGISCDVNCSCVFLGINQFPLVVFNISLFICSDHVGIMQYNNFIYVILYYVILYYIILYYIILYYIILYYCIAPVVWSFFIDYCTAYATHRKRE